MREQVEQKKLVMVRIEVTEEFWSDVGLLVDAPSLGRYLFKHLYLPDEYTFVRCAIVPHLHTKSFRLFISHPDFPEVEEEQDIPQMTPLYTFRSDGSMIFREMSRVILPISIVDMRDAREVHDERAN